ncbi:pseudouridine synthase [uncultured Oscillibacter sp.]|jgi:23S rRNA pseudouridine2605 synthase|uniref:pseudouridine synthase n=1 Tax=uncultured Oscillibacter sp. TaxID=876091 RepID=UPI00216D2942|nr:pseudouridine synthase [uncultured Oscillibacter sp.]MCI9554916.1 rRNA pseudouridine synthase [Oscillibacter sp.]
MEERLQKLLSAAGVCSRRAAEGYIEAGRVTVNGETVRLGAKADPERDDIRLDGRPLPEREETVCLLLNKPRGYVTTLSDEKGRRTVAELVADCGVRVYPVGRLDLDSEGLLLLTNDGELAQRVTHPSREVEKTYHVWVRGPVKGAAARLSRVTDLEGEAIRPARVEVLRQGEETAALAVTIHQGKNRQVRRMCAACGLEVTRLRRVREHTLTLGSLPPGKWRYLTAAEIRDLRGGSR